MNASDDLPDPVSAVDHVRGAHDAPVTIIEYGDFECASCKKAAPAVLMLIKRFDCRVRLVFRHFPLEEVHANALTAAEASEAAAAQGRFWEMHDQLFDKQVSSSRHSLAAARGRARARRSGDFQRAERPRAPGTHTSATPPKVGASVFVRHRPSTSTGRSVTSPSGSRNSSVPSKKCCAGQETAQSTTRRQPLHHELRQCCRDLETTARDWGESCLSGMR